MPGVRSLTPLLFAVLALSAAAAVVATAAAVGSAAPTAQSPSDAVYRKLCRAIRPQHVRALFTGAVAPIRLGGDADCAFSPRGGDPSWPA